MAATFKDFDGYETYEVDLVEDIDTNYDIISNKTTGYFVIINDNKIEVSKEVYEKIKEIRNFD